MITRPTITVKSRGSFKNTFKYLEYMSAKHYLDKLEEYAEMGLTALQEATPVDTGLTARSWQYHINVGKDRSTISWTNANDSAEGIPVVILLVYGHGTRSGTYVQGRDFITPAIEPVFDHIASDFWMEVSKAK